MADAREPDRLTLKYSGDRASLGEMEAHDLSDAIAGFSDFIVVAGTAGFGDDFEARSVVSALREGSFDIEFVLHLLSGEAASLLYATLQAPAGFAHFVKLFVEAFDLFKHLKGKPAKEVQKQPDGTVNVTNNNGVVNNYSADTLVIISNPVAGRAIRRFAGKPLEQSAAQIEVLSGGKTIASATREDVGSFLPIAGGEILAENANEIHLTIQTAVFEGASRWKFSDGQKTFSAPIEDTEFLAGVARGQEAFRKGDELIVRMRSTQKRINGKLKAEYAVEKVLEHISRRSETRRLF